MPFSDSGDEWGNDTFFTEPTLEELMQYVGLLPAPAPAPAYTPTQDYFSFDQSVIDPAQFVAAPTPAPAPTPTPAYFAPTPAPVYSAPAYYEPPAAAPIAQLPVPTPAPAPVNPYQDFIQSLQEPTDIQQPFAPAPAAPAPAPVTASPAPADGYWTTVGSGEERQDVWVPPPAPAAAPPAAPKYGQEQIAGAKTMLDIMRRYGDVGQFGWAGADPYTYSYTETGDQGQAGQEASGVTDEFIDWLKQSGLSATAKQIDPYTYEYAVTKDGNVIKTDRQSASGFERFMDVAAPIALNAILGTATGGALSGLGLTGAANSLLTSALVQAGTTGKIDPVSLLASAAGSAAGQGLGDVTGNPIVDNALKTVAAQEAKSVISGQGLVDPTQALIGSLLNTGIGQVGAAADLDPATVKALTPIAAAVLTGKDPTSAITSTLLNQGIGALTQGWSPDTGDETERLAARYPAPTPAPAPEQTSAAEAPTPAPAPEPAPVQTVQQLADALAEPTAPETLQDIIAAQPPVEAPAPTTAPEEVAAPASTAAAVAAVNPPELPTGVADAVTQYMQETQAAPLTTQEAEDRQAVQDAISATAPSLEPVPEEAPTPAPAPAPAPSIEEQLYAAGVAPEQTAEPTAEEILSTIAEPPAPTPPPPPVETAPAQATAPVETPPFEQTTEAPSVPDYTEDLFPEDKPIETKTLTDEDIANMPGYGNLEQDYAVTDTGKILDTSTGQTGVFDENGEWSPDYDIGSLADLGDLSGTAEIVGTKDEQQLQDEAAAQDALDLITAGGGMPRDVIPPLDLSGSLDEFNKDVDQRVSEELENLPDLSTGLDDLLKTTDAGKGGGKTTTGGGTTQATAAKSDDDLLTMLLAMGMLGDEEQGQVPVQELFASDPHSLEKIFGNYFA